MNRPQLKIALPVLDAVRNNLLKEMNLLIVLFKRRMWKRKDNCR